MQFKNKLHNYLISSEFDPELLPPKEKRNFEEAGIFIKYKKNEVIYGEGSSPKGAYLLKKGMVKVIQVNSEGNEQIIFFFSPGEIFGFRALLSNDKHVISAVCMESCEIKFIEAEVFIKLIETSVTLTKQLLSRMCHEFSILVNRINIYAQKRN